MKTNRIEALKKRLVKVEAELNKCRTTSREDGWQSSKHARKARKWDHYAQEKMRIISALDELGAL